MRHRIGGQAGPRRQFRAQRWYIPRSRDTPERGMPCGQLWHTRQARRGGHRSHAAGGACLRPHPPTVKGTGLRPRHARRRPGASSLDPGAPVGPTTGKRGQAGACPGKRLPLVGVGAGRRGWPKATRTYWGRRCSGAAAPTPPVGAGAGDDQVARETCRGTLRISDGGPGGQRGPGRSRFRARRVGPSLPPVARESPTGAVVPPSTTGPVAQRPRGCAVCPGGIRRHPGGPAVAHAYSGGCRVRPWPGRA